MEKQLAEADSHQIPVNPEVKATLPEAIEHGRTVHPMAVDFEKAADMWDEVQSFLRDGSRGSKRLEEVAVNPKILIRVTAPAVVIGLLFRACLVGVFYVTRLQANMSDILSRNVASLQAAQELEIRVRQLRFHNLLYLIWNPVPPNSVSSKPTNAILRKRGDRAASQSYGRGKKVGPGD